MRRSLWMPVAAMVASAVLSSCGRGPQTHFYTLAEPPAPIQSPGASGPSVLVGHILTSTALQDSRIRYRVGPNEIGSYEYQRWTESPGTMVRGSLVQALRRSGRYRSIQEAGSASDGDYLVHGRLIEFSEIDGSGIQTRVSLHLEVNDRKTGKMVFNHLYTRDEPVQDKAMPTVVASLDHNLQQVLAEAASQIGDSITASKP